MLLVLHSAMRSMQISSSELLLCRCMMICSISGITQSLWEERREKANELLPLILSDLVPSRYWTISGLLHLHAKLYFIHGSIFGDIFVNDKLLLLPTNV